jgi:hypothetical protein
VRVGRVLRMDSVVGATRFFSRWAMASVATVVALYSAWHSGGHMWQRLNQDYATFSAYSEDQRRLAPIDAIPLPGDIFDWYALKVRRGDRFYSQVLQSGFGALTLPQIVERVEDFYLLPAMQVTDLNRATVVVSYSTDPALLHRHFLTQQQPGVQIFYVSRLRVP